MGLLDVAGCCWVVCQFNYDQARSVLSGKACFIFNPEQPCALSKILSEVMGGPFKASICLRLLLLVISPWHRRCHSKTRWTEATAIATCIVMIRTGMRKTYRYWIMCVCAKACRIEEELCVPEWWGQIRMICDLKQSDTYDHMPRIMKNNY